MRECISLYVSLFTVCSHFKMMPFENVIFQKRLSFTYLHETIQEEQKKHRRIEVGFSLAEIMSQKKSRSVNTHCTSKVHTHTHQASLSPLLHTFYLNEKTKK